MTAALAVLALGLGIQIEGAPGCPDPSEIHELMRPLLPPALWESALHSARVERVGEELNIRLTDQGGIVLANRKIAIATSSTCSEQAKEVAVILAAWEVRLQAGDLGMPELPPPPPPPLPPPPTGLEVGGGALMSLVKGQAAFGGMGTLVLGGKTTPWIGTLALTGVGTHSVDLAPGSADWGRFALMGGPGLRIRWGVLALEPNLSLALCWIRIRGDGYSHDQTVNDWDVGVWAGARLSLDLGRLRPWFSASIGDWLRGQEVQVTGLSGSVVLPKGELLLALGLSFELQ